MQKEPKEHNDERKLVANVDEIDPKFSNNPRRSGDSLFIEVSAKIILKLLPTRPHHVPANRRTFFYTEKQGETPQIDT